MKKLSIILVAILSLVCLSATAKGPQGPKVQSCPFTDNFYLNEGIIYSLKSSGISAQEVSPTYFITGCQNNSWATGDVYLTVLSISGGYCSLDIQDGASMMDPTIASVTCQGGMQYTGMDHQFGSFNYTLKFNG